MTYLSTPDGPLLSGASPDLLGSLLVDYEAELTRLGGPVAETMRPGLDSTDVATKLASRGLSCPDELAVWFGWHNGVELEGIRTAGIPLIFPADLDTCLSAYDDSRIELESYVNLDVDYESLAYGAVEGWIRLQSISNALTVECNSSGPRPPRVRWANVEFTNPDYPDSFRALSLCTVVARWLESAKCGAFEWSPSQHRWIVHDELFLSDLTNSPLG